MKTFFKPTVYALSIFFWAFSAAAADNGDCPTDSVKGLSGTFSGTMVMLDPALQQTALQNVTDLHTFDGCTKFSADIRYTDPDTNAETRRQSFNAEWDADNQVFKLDGGIMKGALRIVTPGTFVLSFDTTLNGAPVHCDETVSLSNKDDQMIRTLHYFSGGIEGPSVGVRVVQETRVP